MTGLEIKTIPVTAEILEKINEAIRVSLEFEALTGKQLNITSIVGEIFASKNFKLVVNDINAGFDALDHENKRVQIKTRRYKDKKSKGLMCGALLDKDFIVPFDYALLVILNQDYSLKEIHQIADSVIQKHFNRINAKRESGGKKKRKNMSVAQYMSLAKKEGLRVYPV